MHESPANPGTRREVTEAEIFVPADPRCARPYIRLASPSGGADWYCWSTQGGGRWINIAGPPIFELRAVGPGADRQPQPGGADRGGEG